MSIVQIPPTEPPLLHVACHHAAAAEHLHGQRSMWRREIIADYPFLDFALEAMIRLSLDATFTKDFLYRLASHVRRFDCGLVEVAEMRDADERLREQVHVRTHGRPRQEAEQFPAVTMELVRLAQVAETLGGDVGFDVLASLRELPEGLALITQPRGFGGG